MGLAQLHKGLGVILKSHDLLRALVMILRVVLSLTTTPGPPGGLERSSGGTIGPLGGLDRPPGEILWDLLGGSGVPPCGLDLLGGPSGPPGWT